jgi:hypothetical protein
MERVLEYKGLSMNKDQVVNRIIEGYGKRRALCALGAQSS